ncbi:uncharacterized protein V6R79_009403 [Siganus canaliculatus]
MQLAFLSLILIAVHVSVPVDCTKRLQDPEQLLQHQQSSLNADTGRFSSENRGTVRKVTHRNLLVILPVSTDTSNFVSIFDLRRKRFICMDFKSKLYNSRLKGKEDCLFQRIWLDLVNHHDVFYSRSAGQLLKLEGAELRVVRPQAPEPSSALLERFLGPMLRRQRRSEEVNPSDPLRSETHPSHPLHPVKTHTEADHGPPERDRAGAVSKETITSCDDPLKVLQPNGPVSPVKTNIADRPEQD